MYHSVTICGKNSYDDYRLIPTSRPSIVPPEPKKTTVDIPGTDGCIDLSLVVSGKPVYENRTGSIEFMALHSGLSGTGYDPTSGAWAQIYHALLNDIHGQYGDMFLEDDPNSVYHGSFKVGEWNTGEKYSTVTIEYDLEPYTLGGTL